MDTLAQFSFQRVAYIIKRHVNMNYKEIFIGFGVAFLSLFLLVTLFVYFKKYLDPHFFISVANNLVFIGGLISTSMLFKELHNPLKAHSYILLPASTNEKFTAYWLLSSVIYLSVSIALLFVLNVLVSGLSLLLFDIPFVVINLFDGLAGKLIPSYLITHSVFFLGAIWFRNNNFLKTILTVAISFIIISIVVLLAVYSIFQLDMSFGGSYNLNFIMGEYGNSSVFGWILSLSVPVFLTVAYFKLKEKQI